MKNKKKIILATKNKGKIKDFQAILPDYELMILDEAYPDIEETGQTFEENALIKAKTVANDFNEIVISDDSGLVCEGLNGSPGVYSSRYSESKRDSDNIKKLLKDIEGKNKDAKFVSLICLYLPNDNYYFFKGEVEGKIIDKPIGDNGFGYDPVFYVEELNKTFGELTLIEKNKISHRKRAIQKLLDSNIL